jgi:hypothetical protein
MRVRVLLHGCSSSPALLAAVFLSAAVLVTITRAILIRMKRLFDDLIGHMRTVEVGCTSACTDSFSFGVVIRIIISSAFMLANILLCFL